jgi:hypothetical protein
MGKMEAKPEVSILELYYSVILCVCERQKGIVCGIVAYCLAVFFSGDI